MKVFHIADKLVKLLLTHISEADVIYIALVETRNLTIILLMD